PKSASDRTKLADTRYPIRFIPDPVLGRSSIRMAGHWRSILVCPAVFLLVVRIWGSLYTALVRRDSETRASSPKLRATRRQAALRRFIQRIIRRITQCDTPGIKRNCQAVSFAITPGMTNR